MEMLLASKVIPKGIDKLNCPGDLITKNAPRRPRGNNSTFVDGFVG